MIARVQVENLETERLADHGVQFVGVGGQTGADDHHRQVGAARQDGGLLNVMPGSHLLAVNGLNDVAGLDAELGLA